MPSKLGFFLRSSLGLFTRSPLGFRDTSKRYTLTDCDGVLDDIATTAQRAFNVDGTHIDLDLQIGRVVTILDKCFEVAVWQEGDPTEFKIIAVVATSTDCAGCSPTSPDIGFMAVRCTADSTPSPGAAIIWGKGDLSAFEGMVVTLEPGVAYKLGEGAIQGVPTACDTNTPVRCLYIVPAADQLEFYQQSSGQADSGSVGSFLNKCDFTPYESSDVIESYADCEACAEDYPPEDPDPPGDPEPDPDCNSRYFRLFECSCGYTPYYIQLCRNTSIRAGQYNGKCYAVIHPGITESTFNALSGIDVTGDFSGAVTSLQISGCDSLTASACPYYRRATLCSDSTVNVWVDRSEAEALGLTSGSTPVFISTDGVCYQYRDDNQTQCPERKGRTVVTIETARGAFANCGACGPLFVMEDADGVQSDRTVSPANQSTDLAAVAATTWASLADGIQSVEFNGTCWTVRAWITGDSTTVQATVVDSQHATVAACNIPPDAPCSCPSGLAASYRVSASGLPCTASITEIDCAISGSNCLYSGCGDLTGVGDATIRLDTADNPDCFWEVELNCDIGGGDVSAFYKKTTGLDPIGTYVKYRDDTDTDSYPATCTVSA